MNLVILLFTMSVGLFSCSQKKLSERDQLIQERQQKIDTKKNELESIAGSYSGKLIRENGDVHQVKLVLQVKEIPQNESQTDPTLTPKLVGNLRFLFGAEDTSEYIDAVIKSAEYNKSTNQISLVVNHHQFNDMLITASPNENSLKGFWNAPSMGFSGQIEVFK